MMVMIMMMMIHDDNDDDSRRLQCHSESWVMELRQHQRWWSRCWGWWWWWRRCSYGWAYLILVNREVPKSTAVLRMRYPAVTSSLRVVPSEMLMTRSMRLSLITEGNWKVDANRACRKASCTSCPKHATSPVECISTPKVGSAPRRRVNENIGAFTAT